MAAAMAMAAEVAFLLQVVPHKFRLILLMTKLEQSWERQRASRCRTPTPSRTAHRRRYPLASPLMLTLVVVVLLLLLVVVVAPTLRPPMFSSLRRLSRSAGT